MFVEDNDRVSGTNDSMSRTAQGMSAMLVYLAWIALARGEPPSAVAGGAAPVIPPFAAEVAVDEANVRLLPDSKSTVVGLLRAGAVVTVTGCDPNCASSDAWALLGKSGAVLLSVLRAVRPSDVVAPKVPSDQLWYGRVSRISRRIYRKPDVRGGIVSRRRIPQEMAFLPDTALRARGWLERVEGGYVRARQVSMLDVAKFTGEAQPSLPLVFVLRPAGSRGAADDLARYDRLPLRGRAGAMFVTDRGTLDKSRVRVIELRKRPTDIPEGDSWVQVNVEQQTLTAYEGDVPVFATLVSSGKSMNRTHVGLYKVEHKMMYSDMHGEPDDPYIVDRVPYVIYFDKNEALHGTYWHDHFGTPASHGCVNLSMSDAKWIFDWSTPALPPGWHDIDPQAGSKALWVLVER